jgi:hypothetical protein
MTESAEAQAPEEVTYEKKSNEDVAKEVLAGQWGRGLNRKKRLQDAGYDVAVISEEIAKIYNGG